MRFINQSAKQFPLLNNFEKKKAFLVQFHRGKQEIRSNILIPFHQFHYFRTFLQRCLWIWKLVRFVAILENKSWNIFVCFRYWKSTAHHSYLKNCWGYWIFDIFRVSITWIWIWWGWVANLNYMDLDMRGVGGIDLGTLLPFFIFFLIWTGHAAGEDKFIWRDWNNLKYLGLKLYKMGPSWCTLLWGSKYSRAVS